MFLTMFELDWISFETLRVVAAIASCANLIKVFDWLRLFSGSSFYMMLIQKTLGDITDFLIIFVVALITFGLPLNMLDLNRADTTLLIEPVLGFWPIDTIYNQYLLSLGEFSTLESLGEGASYEKLVLLFFMIATFYTQITMLNMLIAIMGDSFDYAVENREKYAVMTKLDLLSA